MILFGLLVGIIRKGMEGFIEGGELGRGGFGLGLIFRKISLFCFGGV